ncbi:MAG: hypothetical protein PUE61_02510 [Clostridiales bacterium]|nr:hypothetical protein [Clostridiales bacterium]
MNDGFKRLFGEAGHLMQLAFLAAGGVVKVKAAVRRVVVGMLQPARRREAAVIAVLGHQVHVDVRAVAVKAGILCQGFPPHSKQNAAASTPPAISNFCSS